MGKNWPKPENRSVEDSSIGVEKRALHGPSVGPDDLCIRHEITRDPQISASRLRLNDMTVSPS